MPGNKYSFGKIEIGRIKVPKSETEQWRYALYQYAHRHGWVVTTVKNNVTGKLEAWRVA